MKRILSILVSALVLSIPSLALADCGHGGGFFGHREGGGRQDQGGRDLLAKMVTFKSFFFLKHAKELGLTKEQTDKIRSVRLEFNKKQVRDQAEIKATAMDLFAELHQSAPDQAKLNSLIDKKVEIKKGLEKGAVQAVLDLKGVLTPEQQEKVKALFTEKKQGGWFHRGNKECKTCSVDEKK